MVKNEIFESLNTKSLPVESDLHSAGSIWSYESTGNQYINQNPSIWYDHLDRSECYPAWCLDGWNPSYEHFQQHKQAPQYKIWINWK